MKGGMRFSLSGEGLSSLSKWACPTSTQGACPASAIGRVFLNVSTVGHSNGEADERFVLCVVMHVAGTSATASDASSSLNG